MSYKHNNLMAMRERYWNDTENNHVDTEKAFFSSCYSSKGSMNVQPLKMLDTSFLAYRASSLLKVMHMDLCTNRTRNDPPTHTNA